MGTVLQGVETDEVFMNFTGDDRFVVVAGKSELKLSRTKFLAVASPPKSDPYNRNQSVKIIKFHCYPPCWHGAGFNRKFRSNLLATVKTQVKTNPTLLVDPNPVRRSKFNNKNDLYQQHCSRMRTPPVPLKLT